MPIRPRPHPRLRPYACLRPRPRLRSRSRLQPRAAALAATTLLLCSPLAGCSDGSDSGGDPMAQKLSWTDCPAPNQAEGGGGSPSPLPHGGTWQCATLKAPLDWKKPKGDTIDLALIRAKARGPGPRIGSLVFNFGGPGASGVATLPSFARDYDKLRTRYDLVSFDPRGVGRSAPVECESDARLDAYLQQDATPDDAAERSRLLKNTGAFNAACEKHSQKLLPHVRTTDAARDMDLMRHVLGDDKLYYFGISYGTELGGVYAHLFPKRVGRVVLDAVVDPTRTPEQASLAQAKGFQHALDNFARSCTSQAGGCPVGDTVQEVEGRIATLLKNLDARPIPGVFPRRLTQTAATSGIAQALYSKDFWQYLTTGLQQAYNGDGEVLQLLADSLNGRDQNGEYSNIIAANTAITCADDRPRYDVGQVRAKLPAFQAASPLFGPYLAWSLLACTDWPVPGAADHPDVSAPGAPPVLVIGNTGDPATPYEGARRMAAALGRGVGVELTYKGQGHGAYNSGNPCVQNAVDRYLLQGRTPPAKTVCS